MSKFYGGCDAGSTYTKCVILNEDGKIVADVTKRSRINPVLSAKDALDTAISQVDGLNSAEELSYLMGEDLQDIKEDISYARFTFIRLNESYIKDIQEKNAEALHAALRAVDYVSINNITRTMAVIAAIFNIITA